MQAVSRDAVHFKGDFKFTLSLSLKHPHFNSEGCTSLIGRYGRSYNARLPLGLPQARVCPPLAQHMHIQRWCGS